MMIGLTEQGLSCWCYSPVCWVGVDLDIFRGTKSKHISNLTGQTKIPSFTVPSCIRKTLSGLISMNEPTFMHMFNTSCNRTSNVKDSAEINDWSPIN